MDGGCRSRWCAEHNGTEAAPTPVRWEAYARLLGWLARRLVRFLRPRPTAGAAPAVMPSQVGVPTAGAAPRSRWGARLVALRTRVFASATVAGAAIFGALAWLVQAERSAGVDLALANAVQAVDDPRFAALMRAVSELGSPPLSTPLVVGGLLLGGLAELGVRYHEGQVSLQRHERALRLVTTSDAQDLWLGPAPSVPEATPGHDRERPRVELALVNLTAFPRAAGRLSAGQPAPAASTTSQAGPFPGSQPAA